MTNLYRHFDASGNLLYIGISISAVNRLSAHSRGSQWFSEIAKIEIQHFDTRELALKAEGLAIGREKPKYNVHHVVKEKPVVVKPVELKTETKVNDRLIDFRKVHLLTGSQCKTGHYARSLASRGLIRAVRFNERVIRYSEHSVLSLVAGNVAA